MKSSRPSNKRHFSLAKLLGLGLGLTALGSSSSLATTYIWQDSNVNTTGSATLDWFSGGTNAQGAWSTTPTAGAGSNADIYQFFAGTTAAFTNTAAVAQTSNIDNGGVARQLGILSLEGLGSATAAASVTLTISGDPLNFSGSTGTINLDALAGTGGITYNVNSAIQLGTAGSGSVLTLQGAGTGAFKIGGAISELQTGGGSLVKAGTSTAVLMGIETYSGATTVNAGTLTLQGNASSAGTSPGGTILNSSAITVGQNATLSLINDNTNGNSANRIGDTTALTMNGGNFNFGSSTAASSTFSETVGQLNVNLGGNRVVTAAASGAGSSSTLTFGALSRTAGTTLSFSTSTSIGAAANKILFTTAPTLDNGSLIGGWATLGGADFATYGANGIGFATYATNTAETTWASTQNIKLTTGTTTLTANRQVNSLLLQQAATTTVALGGFTLRVQDGGVLASGATLSPSINGGNLTAGNGDNVAGELILMSSQANTRPLTVSANLVDNGSGVVSLVTNGSVNSTSGTGQIVLTGTNTYNGTTTVAGGYLAVGTSAALNNSKALIVAAGGTLELGGNTATVDALSGGGTVSIRNSSNSATSGSTLSLGNSNGSGTYTGTFDVVSSTGRNLSIIKNGTGTQVLAGSDFRDVSTTATSATTVNNGILQFAKTVSLYNSNPAKYTATNIIVNNGGTLALNVGGTGEFTSANVDTIKALGTATGGFQSGSSLGLDTTNAGGTFTYASTITDTNAGTNIFGLTKLGTGTLALTSNGNSYRGATTLVGGTLNIVGINSLGGANYGGVVFKGGTLQYAAALQSGSDISVPGAGVTSGAAVTLAAGGGTVDTNGNVVTFANTIGNGGVGALTVASTVSGGSLTLAATNTYTGPTNVASGALLVNGSIGTTATPAGALAVNGTANLGGTGTITVASATVSSAATLAPGPGGAATTGALTLNTTNGLTLSGTLQISTGTSGAGTYLNTGALTLGTGSTLTVTGSADGTSIYDVANYNSLTGGAFTNLTIPAGYAINYAGTTFTGAAFGNALADIELVPAVVPEPSTYLGGALLVGVAGWSLRRRSAARKLVAN